MPSTSKKQQGFFYAELERRRKGLKTRTGLSEKVIKEFTKLKNKHMR